MNDCLRRITGINIKQARLSAISNWKVVLITSVAISVGLLITLPLLDRVVALEAYSLRALSSPSFDGSARTSLTGSGNQSDINVRDIELANNDIVYDKKSNTLFASIPGTVPGTGNSIAFVDPMGGNVVQSVFIGSEPDKMAISDDGQYLYAGMDGANIIRRFDIPSKTAGPQFGFGADQGVYSSQAGEMAVAPGNHDVIAVCRRFVSVSPWENGIVVFDGGVQRPTVAATTFHDGDHVAFSSSGTQLYSSGNFGQLDLLTIDSSGVSITKTETFLGGSIRFDNGLVYGSAGQVINPATGQAVGAFPNISDSYYQDPAFTIDSQVGRAYFLSNIHGSNGTGTPGTVTLSAFDINTFSQVGSQDIPGVVGRPSRLLRWGSNGLAFRTSTQLFVIQTSLIPSAQPVPSPTPSPSPTASPSPTPIDINTSELSLATNELIYNPQTQMIFASVPSSNGSNGNSVAQINPATAAIGTYIFVGSEPNKMAISDDRRYLYVGLDGVGAVRRVEINTQTAGLQFQLGNDSQGGPLFAADISVMPGSPQTVAVAKVVKYVSPSSRPVAIFDNGTIRPKTFVKGSEDGEYFVKFSSSPNKLYGFDFGYSIDVITVDQSGLAPAGKVPAGARGEIKFDNGLIFTSGGSVVDPEAGVLKGRFSIATPGQNLVNPVVEPDSANGRVFFLLGRGSGTVLRAFDVNTFLPLGSIALPNVRGVPESLVRWGVNGLAFRTDQNQIFLLRSSLVNPSFPAPSPSPTPSPSPSPTPQTTPYFLRTVNLAANDLAYNSATQTIYASVPDTEGANGNSITAIDAPTATIRSSVPIGSGPSTLALSDDGQYLYVSLAGAKTIRRLDTASQTAGLQFPWPSGFGVQDIKVVPGSAHSLAVDGIIQLDILDDGVRRPNNLSQNGGNGAAGTLAFGSSASTLYTVGGGTSGALSKLSVDSSGVTLVKQMPGFMGDSNSEVKFDHGFLYGNNGTVADPEAGTLIGTFQVMKLGYPPTMAVDYANGRAFFAAGTPTSDIIVTAFDLNTFNPVGSVTLTGITGNPFSMFRWGVNGLAFRASDQVYLLQTTLVSPAASIPVAPTTVQFPSRIYTVDKAFGAFATIRITRTGADLTGTSTVDYATTDGTASQTTDYTTATGTLRFAPGETSKTFQLLITNNSYAEGDRVVNLNLSNPTGAQLTAMASATLTIHDHNPPNPVINPVDDPTFFVYQLYADFLSRYPDQSGAKYWTDGITQCGTDQKCIHDRRVATANAFFFEPEFQDTGAYVYRIYKAAFGAQPTYAQFTPDRARVIGGATLDASKINFAISFSERSNFTAKYSANLAGPDFVDALLKTAGDTTGVDLSTQRGDLINKYNSGNSQAESRGLVLRAIADAQAFFNAEYNESFVVMEYFAYLRRDPDGGGQAFWLGQVNAHPMRDIGIQHAMVCSFITSTEYQKRFSSVVTHSNSECPQ